MGSTIRAHLEMSVSHRVLGGALLIAVGVGVGLAVGAALGLGCP